MSRYKRRAWAVVDAVGGRTWCADRAEAEAAVVQLSPPAKLQEYKVDADGGKHLHRAWVVLRSAAGIAFQRIPVDGR